MPYGNLAHLKEVRQSGTFSSLDAAAEHDQAIRQAEADALRKGTELLSASAQRLTEEYDAWSADAIEIAEGFEAVAREADRPDSDFKVVLKTSQDLEARAKVLSVWRDQLRERMALHNERAGDPVGYHEEFIEKWAGKSLTNRDRFLHFYPTVR